MHAVTDALKFGRVHLVGTVYGGLGYFACDFAHPHPERGGVLVISSIVLGVSEPEATTLAKGLCPEGFFDLTDCFVELGSAYCAADPGGVVRWKQMVELPWTVRTSSPRAWFLRTSATSRAGSDAKAGRPAGTPPTATALGVPSGWPKDSRGGSGGNPWQIS
jgi:hypothetical protein